jgi:hypothetical protein
MTRPPPAPPRPFGAIVSHGAALGVAAGLALAPLGCAESKSTPAPDHQTPATGAARTASPSNAPASPAGCTKEPMADDVQKLRETTNPTLSDHQVGISNIFERDLPDASGTVGPRLSAVLVIFDPATKQSRRETVTADSVVTIGHDRYCVVSLEEGKAQPGSISIRKLAP